MAIHFYIIGYGHACSPETLKSINSTTNVKHVTCKHCLQSDILKAYKALGFKVFLKSCVTNQNNIIKIIK